MDHSHRSDERCFHRLAKSTTPQLLNFSYPALHFNLLSTANTFLAAREPTPSEDQMDGLSALIYWHCRQHKGKVTFNGTWGVTTTSINVNFIVSDNQTCPVHLSSTDSTVINNFTRYTDSGSGRVRSVSITGVTPHTAYYGPVNYRLGNAR